MRTGAAIHAAGAAFLSALILLIPSQVHGQDGFLFGQPTVTFSLYGGWAMPTAGSDVFDEARRDLTVGQGDFNSPLGMAEIALRVTERIDVAVGVTHASRTADSEMAEWEWADGRPILQSTEFSRTGVMASGKYYLLPRGREISRFAWVPYRWAPYIGGGAGLSHYTFSRTGDYAVQLGDDPLDRDILAVDVESEDRGVTAHALAGAQLSLSKRVLIRGEYRYIWGSADLDPTAFQGYDPIDLSGSNVMLGLSLRL